MNLPNLISLSRIALAPLFAALYTRGRVLQALAVLLLAAASDLLDGAVARRFHQVTDLGKILDPVADKLMQAAMMLCAAARTPAVWLLLGLHLLREGCLALLGLRVLQVTGRVWSARWYGKACTALLYAVMIALLALPELPAGLEAAALAACAGMMLLCLCLYFRRFCRILRLYAGGGLNAPPKPDSGQ